MRPRSECGFIRSQKARVQAMLASSSSGASQTESIDTMYGIDRSPKAESAAATRAVAPPKFQIEESVLGDGGLRVACDDQVDGRIVETAQVVALPVAAVLAEGMSASNSCWMSQ